jgi:hypothetical protein
MTATASSNLARYLARPPIAVQRLTRLPDGRIVLRFKSPFSDGTESVVFTPFESGRKFPPSTGGGAGVTTRS